MARQADQDQPFEGDAIMIEPLETATNFPIDDDSTGNLTQRFGYGFHHGSFHQGKNLSFFSPLTSRLDLIN